MGCGYNMWWSILVFVLASSCALCCLVRGAENREVAIFPTSGCSPLGSKSVGLLIVGSADVLNSFVFSPLMEASGSTGTETFLSAIGSSGRELFVGDIFGFDMTTRTFLLCFP